MLVCSTNLSPWFSSGRAENFRDVSPGLREYERETMTRGLPPNQIQIKRELETRASNGYRVTQQHRIQRPGKKGESPKN